MSGTSSTSSTSDVSSTSDMSGISSARSASGTASAPATNGAPTAGTATDRRGILHGLPWLVWHRHRTALRAGLLITIVACALFVYQRMQVMDFLNAKGASPDSEGNLLNEFQNRFGSTFSGDLDFLKLVPVLVGVFLGAPLISSEQEHGTIKLVTTQSAGRGRWITATLGLPLALAALCTTLLTAAFSWLWSPAHELAMSGDWLNNGAFEVVGPVPVAITLFMTACGIGIGMLVKRVVTAMAATAALALVASMVWSEQVRGRLGTLRSVTYPYNGEVPDLPPGSVRVDDWVATADGKLFGFGTCTHADADACRAKLGIVNRVIQYFDYGQMAGMQWLGAGILLALTAVVLAFVVWRARRRPL
ncbi:ABC transporter permease subunit [Streptomyces sp. NPDC050636]|uniref:ABC transporter permease subunit n=1 Tax=Streptomyces sp. NPDC050636 TaxID=3154510 RepID=UPI003439EFA5